ncbi:C6 transcription factor [Purpureocillium lavendulum]|uniref:C6 transcription factor n=1 Tax=Purpureocillium lavendulum TaxID=1247861 RepID=A0AB34FSC1_9HYPO|nr:C6 transcription factor [Purpureocillium lavendulum]
MAPRNPSRAMDYYDIAMRPPRASTCCSPNPWKARLALNFKNIEHSTKWVPLPEIAQVRRDLGLTACRKFGDGSDFFTLPILVDPNTGSTIGDSFDIAVYLQKTYPESGAGDLFPAQKLEFEYDPGFALLVPLSEQAKGDYDDYAKFNTTIDAAFTANVGLMAYTMPFDPATAEASRAIFVQRAGVSSWEDFQIKGEARDKAKASFRAMLGDLAKLYARDTSGPFLLGKQASYADMIIGGWVYMAHATLPDDEWQEMRGWHDSTFGRLYDGLQAYAEVKEAARAGDGCHGEEASSLNSYLDGTLTAQGAAVAITRPVLEEDDPPAALYRLMGLLCQALAELGDERTKLLDLVTAIQALPATSQVDWSQLPGFGNMWSDLYRLHFHGANDWEKSDGLGLLPGAEKVELRQHYTAIGAVEAGLCLRGLGGVTSRWGYETLNLVCSGRPGVDVFLSSMFQWLAVAGTRLKRDLEPDRACSYGKRMEVEATMAQHWETWRRAFLQLSEGDDSLSVEGRELAAGCHRMMQDFGDQPCAQCAHLNLACVFAPAPAKRKPGVRGRLVAQLRNRAAAEATTTNTNGRHQPVNAAAASVAASITSPAAASTSSSASSPTSGGGGLPPTLPAVTSIAGIVDNATSAAHAAVSPRFELAPAIGGGGYSQDFFMKLLPEYEQLVYPVNPVLTPDELRDSIANMHASFEDAALVHAFGAVTINLTQTSWTLHGDIAAQMTSLIQYSLWAHRKAEMGRDSDGAHYLQCEMPMTRFDRSFASLRESITMIQMLNRMYWEAYIHERFIGLPLTDTDVPPYVTVGFNRLIRLFQIMDPPLLAHWTAQTMHSDDAPTMTAQWIESKQAQLDADEAETADAARDLSASGAGALSEEQHLALSHGLLRSAPPRDAHEGLSLHFPAQRLSAQLRGLVSRLGNMSSIVIHGSGILQKLFEITSTDEARARIEDFLFIVRFIFGFERTQKHQRDYLREKLDALREMYTVVDFGDLAGSPAAEHP